MSKIKKLLAEILGVEKPDSVTVNFYTKEYGVEVGKTNARIQQLQEDLDRWNEGINTLWVLKPEYDLVVDFARHLYHEALEQGGNPSFRTPSDKAILETETKN